MPFSPGRRLLLIPLLLGLGAAALTAACSPPPSGPSAGLLVTVGEEALEADIALLPAEGPEGIGALRRPVTTDSAEAQALYDQGRALLASFDWVRAARSFRAALASDSRLAAAHVGLARAYLGLEAVDRALAEAREAERLGEEQNLPEAERTWIALGTAQMEAAAARGEERRRLHAAYLEAIENASERNPDDVDLLILRGNADPQLEGWGQAGGEASLPWYRRALELRPDSFAVHHFLAHSLENTERYPEAAEHARRFAAAAPAIPHAHHMVGHVTPRLGKWEEARAALLESDALHRAMFSSGELAPHQDWHHGHNLRLLGSVHGHLGEADLARERLKEAFELPYTGRRAGFYCVPWLELLLVEERYAEALEAARACEERPGPLAAVVGTSFRGEALLGLGRSEEARQALEETRRAYAHFREQAGPPVFEMPFLVTAGVALDCLEGKLKLAAGETEAGREHLERVASTFERLASFDAWAMGERRLADLAAAARRAGQADFARRCASLRLRLAGLEEEGGALPSRPMTE